MTNSLPRNDRLVTVDNECLKIPPSTSAHSLNSCGMMACCSSELIFTFLYVGSSIQNARKQFVTFVHNPFVNSAFHAPSQKKNLTELALESQIQWTLELRPAWHKNNLGYDQNFSFDLRPKSGVMTLMPVKAKTRGCKQRPEMHS